MYRRYLLKRLAYGLLMYAAMILSYSAIFNRVAEETVRAQIEEQLVQEAAGYRNQSPAGLQAIMASRRAAKLRQYRLDQGFALRVLGRAADSLRFDFGDSSIMKAPNGDGR